MSAIEVYKKNIVEFLTETNQQNFATRADCVSYCIGYYGKVNTDCWEAINQLYQYGMIKA